MNTAWLGWLDVMLKDTVNETKDISNKTRVEMLQHYNIVFKKKTSVTVI